MIVELSNHERFRNGVDCEPFAHQPQPEGIFDETVETLIEAGKAIPGASPNGKHWRNAASVREDRRNGVDSRRPQEFSAPIGCPQRDRWSDGHQAIIAGE